MAKVIVAPTDWGLGHSTRDIPIIRELQRRGHEVTVATGSRALSLLKQEVPECRFLTMPGPKVRYGRTKFFITEFVREIPKVLLSYNRENRDLHRLLEKESFDLIISDSRFGFYSEWVPSYLINHQISFDLPLGRAVEYAMARFNEYNFSNFNRVIVPDQNLKKGLAGGIAKTKIEGIRKKLFYAGILSSVSKTRSKEDIDYLISISGPEPQRTLLEKTVLPQMKHLEGKKVVVLGLPQSNKTRNAKDLFLKDHANREEMADYMNRARFIITRSGYTTMMEVAELDKKRGLFIPTPGQPEQEYLSKWYEKNNWFHSVQQNKLNLAKDVSEAEGYKGFPEFRNTQENVKLLYDQLFSRHLD